MACKKEEVKNVALKRAERNVNKEDKYMSKKFKCIMSVVLAALLVGVVVLPVSMTQAALINPGTEVFQVIVTDATDGSTAVLKDTRYRKAGDVFKITNKSVKKEASQGNMLLVTKTVSTKTGAVKYSYKAGNERIDLGFVKDAKTVVDTKGKTFKFSNNFGAGTIVEIVYNSKFTYVPTDDTFKTVRVLSTVKR